MTGSVECVACGMTVSVLGGVAEKHGWTIKGGCPMSEKRLLPIVLRSPAREKLTQISDSGHCTAFVRRRAGGWVKLCSEPTTFGRKCVGHSMALEVFHALNGIVDFLRFAA